jgi:hypothetical protein
MVTRQIGQVTVPSVTEGLDIGNQVLRHKHIDGVLKLHIWGQGKNQDPLDGSFCPSFLQHVRVEVQWLVHKVRRRERASGH